VNYGDLEPNFKRSVNNIIHQPLGYLNIKNIFLFNKILKNGKFDTIIDFNGNFSGVVMLLAFRLGIKNRITFYRRSTNAYKKSFISDFYNFIVNRLVLKYSTKILSNSKSALDFFFKNKYPNNFRFKIINNGVNPKIFHSDFDKTKLRRKYGLPLDKKIIGHVGRFDIAKNHESIFKVAQKLNNSNYHFVFCGYGTDSLSFFNKLDEYSIKDYSTCLGLKNEVEEILNTFDIFYFPSITEGQPNALIEAIMCRVPILASNIDPIKEIIPSKYLKNLVKPEDIKNAINRINRSEYIKLTNDEIKEFNYHFNSICRFEEFKLEI